MLTLRFEKHGKIENENYMVYECEKYNVSFEWVEAPIAGEERSSRRVVRMFRYLQDENPYYESIGDKEPFGVCYVMNSNGKTIDTIR